MCIRDRQSRLLVAADVADPTERASNVMIFELPTVFNTNGDSLFAENVLNAGLLTSGLDDNESLRVSAMAEFEGVLYLLHDNVRTIRGWNLQTGVLVHEFTTPRAGSGFNRQWEGLFLERDMSGAVVLHMALDTPAQIWSFYLVQDVLGGFTFPRCAQAN